MRLGIYRQLRQGPRSGLRNAGRQRKRRLTDAEYAAAAIRSSDLWPAIPAATRFLALTGWRSGEAISLRKADVDLARRTALLGDTKTGQSMRPLSHRAIRGPSDSSPGSMA